MLRFAGLTCRLGRTAQLKQCMNTTRFFGLFSQAEGRSQKLHGTDTIEVCFIDPKIVMDRSENKTEADMQYVKLTIPCSFLSDLSKGHEAPLMVASVQSGGLLSSVVLQGVNELGDTDDPMNNWYFGKAGEIFQYQLVGTHPTSSGFTSVIAQHALDEILAGDVRHVPRWSEFLQLFNDDKLAWPSRRTPFLFAGRVVDSDEVAVYLMKNGNEVQGVMASSMAFNN